MAANLLTVAKDDECPWQPEIVDSKADVTSEPKDSILEEPGSVLPGAVATVMSDGGVSPGTSGPQILEACAEAMIQHSIEGFVRPGSHNSPQVSPILTQNIAYCDDTITREISPVVPISSNLTPIATDITHNPLFCDIPASALSPIAGNIPNAVTYCDDVVPSDMAANFRTYMTHLSQLSPENDNSRTPLLDPQSGVTRLLPGNTANWAEESVDMCSSDSESEPDCGLACEFGQSRTHGRQTARSHRTRHSEDTSYDSVGPSLGHSRRNPHFPYESFGTPRVAWSDTPREAWHDRSEDPMYDSLNPYALFNLPKSSQRGKRKQKMHSCTCRLRGSDRRSNDSELIGRANSARNTGACGIQQQENVGGFYGRESPVIQNSGHTEGFLANDRYAQAGNTSPQPSTSGLVGNRLSHSRNNGHSNSLPIFSTHESMDINSDSGESTDTDVNIMSIDHQHKDRSAMNYEFNTSCSNCGRSDCKKHGHHVDNQSSYICNSCRENSLTHEHVGVIRPKAIKLESGQKYHKCEPTHSESRQSRSRPLGAENRHSCTYHAENRRESVCSHQNDTFPTSENRVLELPMPNDSLNHAHPQASVNSDNHSNSLRESDVLPSKSKSLKEIQNSVIKEHIGIGKTKKTQTAEKIQSRIDLTGAENEHSRIKSDQMSSQHGFDKRGTRPPRRRQDLSSRATVVVDLTESDCDDPSILATAGAPNSLTPTFDLDLHPDNSDLDQQLEESSRRSLVSMVKDPPRSINSCAEVRNSEGSSRLHPLEQEYQSSWLTPSGSSRSSSMNTEEGHPRSRSGSMESCRDLCQGHQHLPAQDFHGPPCNRLSCTQQPLCSHGNQMRSPDVMCHPLSHVHSIGHIEGTCQRGSSGRSASHAHSRLTAPVPSSQPKEGQAGTSAHSNMPKSQNTTPLSQQSSRSGHSMEPESCQAPSNAHNQPASNSSSNSQAPNNPLPPSSVPHPYHQCFGNVHSHHPHHSHGHGVSTSAPHPAVPQSMPVAPQGMAGRLLCKPLTPTSTLPIMALIQPTPIPIIQTTLPIQLIKGTTPTQLTPTHIPKAAPLQPHGREPIYTTTITTQLPSTFPQVHSPHFTTRVPAPHPHQHQQLPPHQDNLRMLDLLRAQFQHAQLVQGSNLLQIPPHSLVETQPPMAHSQTSCSLDSAPRPPANNQHPQSTPQGQHQHLHHHLHHYHHAGVPRLHHFAAVPGVHYGELLHLEERLGNVNRGASQDVKIINEDEEDDSNHMEKCTICLSEFENDEDRKIQVTVKNKTKNNMALFAFQCKFCILKINLKKMYNLLKIYLCFFM
ncbi:LOW QUALITY PROTEIN: hypothetical protein MAR_003114, partial [Mya arenaria]